jgi:hypothetical protein
MKKSSDSNPLLIADESDTAAGARKYLSLTEIYLARRELERRIKEKKEKPEAHQIVQTESTDKGISAPLFLNEAYELGHLLLFEVTADNHLIKTHPEKLSPRLKEVFEEILFSLPLNSNQATAFDGCYSFSYSDDEHDISVISIVLSGKAALFYKLC